MEMSGMAQLQWNGVVCFLFGYHNIAQTMAIMIIWYRLYQLWTNIGLSSRIMYLSYSPLIAPITAAAATNHIHLLCTKSTCSFLLDMLRR